MRGHSTEEKGHNGETSCGEVGDYLKSMENPDSIDVPQQ